MPEHHIPLLPNNTYHIYNRGINSCPIFHQEADYFHFLKLYAKFVNPVAHTYAWALMGNHFHFAVHIKDGIQYKYNKEDFCSISNADADQSGNTHKANNDVVGSAPTPSWDDVKWETEELPDPSAYSDGVARKEQKEQKKKTKTPNPTSHLSHLFSSYSKYFNAKYNRHGALFERPFRRKEVTTESYLRTVVIYIHQNPVHHEICNYPEEYSWTSYNTCLSDKPTQTKKDKVLNCFKGANSFKQQHKDLIKEIELDYWFEP